MDPWTRYAPDRPAAQGCPAYAGMDPRIRHTENSLLPRRLPRLRGDGPRELPNKSQFLVAARLRGLDPKPTRGWSGLVIGCPSYAGMDPTAARRFRVYTGLPRLRGDGPRATVAGFVVIELEGCPAYAGMDPKAQERIR